MDKKKMAVCLVVLLVCVGVGWLIYERSGGGSDNGNDNNVDVTIQRAETEIRDVGTEIDAATAELDRGQDAVNGAENAVGKLEDISNERTKLIDECEQLINEIRNIFADVDEQNRADGKHEQSNRTTT